MTEKNMSVIRSNVLISRLVNTVCLNGNTQVFQ